MYTEPPIKFLCSILYKFAMQLLKFKMTTSSTFCASMSNSTPQGYRCKLSHCIICSEFRNSFKCFIAALNSTSLFSMLASKVFLLFRRVCCSQCAASLLFTRMRCSMCVCFTSTFSRMCFIACATSTMRRGEGGGVEGRGEGGTARRLANQIRIHTNLITYTLRIPSHAIQINTTNLIQINTKPYKSHTKNNTISIQSAIPMRYKCNTYQYKSIQINTKSIQINTNQIQIPYKPTKIQYKSIQIHI